MGRFPAFHYSVLAYYVHTPLKDHIIHPYGYYVPIVLLATGGDADARAKSKSHTCVGRQGQGQGQGLERGPVDFGGGRFRLAM
jgi:hypothetical protein